MARGHRHDVRAALAGRAMVAVVRAEESPTAYALRRTWHILDTHEWAYDVQELRDELAEALAEGDGRMEWAVRERMAQYLSPLLGYDYSSVEGSLVGWACHVCEQDVVFGEAALFSFSRDQAVHDRCCPDAADVGFARGADPVAWMCEAIAALDAGTRSLPGD